MDAQHATTHIDTSALIGLTETDRLDARDTARQNVIRRYGSRPARADFEHHTGGQYPRYVTLTVTGIMLVLLIAFFGISAMRLYTIGSETFGARIANDTARLLAGVAIVIGSEAGALGFLLAAGVLAQERQERRTLYGLAFASTAIALTGNVQFALGGNWRGMLIADPFAILEAVLPPVVVLGGGLVFKRLWLDDIQRRHENERAYQAALAEWQALTAEPEQSPHWQSAYASALRSKLIEVNGSGRGRSDREAIMQRMTRADWRRLVWAELQADDWFGVGADSAQDAQHAAISMGGGNHPRPLSDVPSGAISLHRNGNGHGARQ